MNSKTKSYIWDIFAAFVYVALGVLGLRLASLNASVSPIWPAAGWALAILQFRGFRAWPIIFISAVITNLTTGSAILTSLSIAFGNTSEALAGLYLIKFLEKKSSQQFALRDLTSMLVIALVSPVTAATVGTTTLYGAGIVPAAAIKDVWLTWWTGDGLGVLVFYPMMSSITNKNLKDVFATLKGKMFIQISWIVAAIVCGYWVFGSEGN
ncbi:MAG TPA: MASE1 domain-containing protein, partial [Pseudobdellovibrionaceae bacterium]|nr:MASE1 domain-containing protein [Pseudobdellovibrionaceae bacterium]